MIYPMEENFQTDCLIVENKNLAPTFLFYVQPRLAWPKHWMFANFSIIEDFVCHHPEDSQMCYIAPGLLVKLSKEKLNTLTLYKKF